MTRNCDSCSHYSWYYDYCNKWKCEMDFRSVCNSYEPTDTPILDYMVNGGNKKKDEF